MILNVSYVKVLDTAELLFNSPAGSSIYPSFAILRRIMKPPVIKHAKSGNPPICFHDFPMETPLFIFCWGDFPWIFQPDWMPLFRSQELTAFHMCHHRSSFFYETLAKDGGVLTIYEYSLLAKESVKVDGDPDGDPDGLGKKGC